MIFERKGQSMPQKVETFHKKFHTTTEAVTPLSKCFFSGIQSDTENYLDNYVKFDGNLDVIFFARLLSEHQVHLSMCMETGKNGNKKNGNALYEGYFL